MAAGFTVANENLAQLQKRLMKTATEQLANRDLSPTVTIDAEVSMRSLSLKLAETLNVLEPTGHLNPPARFMSKNLRVVDYRVLSNGAHLKMKLAEGHQPAMDAIAFGFGHVAENMYGNIDAVYALEVNEYNGRRNPQLVIQDMRQALDV
jgi:single-stranded-DNA-specific exonuclease